MTERVPVYLRGQVVAHAVIDVADAAWLNQWRWRLDRDGYAVRYDHRRRRTIYMARAILGLDFGDRREADHVDRNKLNNTRANLRIVTRAEQMQNTPARRGATSRFRGVYFDRTRGKWAARVQLNRKTHCLGRFDDEREAARVAAAFRSEHMPFAVEEQAA